jgi:hypothetical protein
MSIPGETKATRRSHHLERIRSKNESTGVVLIGKMARSKMMGSRPVCKGTREGERRKGGARVT